MRTSILWIGVGALVCLSGCASRSAHHPSTRVSFAPHAEPELVVREGVFHAAPMETGNSHRVAAGETLYRIAKNHGLSVAALAQLNGITDPTALAVGQELKLPPKPALSVAQASKAEGSRTRPSQLAISRTPPRQVQTPAGTHGGTLRWPVRGVLYARFGKKGHEPHDGIDLAAPLGTPVHTAAEGKVLYAGEQKGYGRIAIVAHPSGLVTVYAHNRDLRVKSGQKVREGQVIATVGQSGRTSGPHLHFEVRQHGRPVDPLQHLMPLSTTAERVGRRNNR